MFSPYLDLWYQVGDRLYEGRRTSFARPSYSQPETSRQPGTDRLPGRPGPHEKAAAALCCTHLLGPDLAPRGRVAEILHELRRIGTPAEVPQARAPPLIRAFQRRLGARERPDH